MILPPQPGNLLQIKNQATSAVHSEISNAMDKIEACRDIIKTEELISGYNGALPDGDANKEHFNCTIETLTCK